VARHKKRTAETVLSGKIGHYMQFFSSVENIKGRENNAKLNIKN
jgi:hypothetical protein